MGSGAFLANKSRELDGAWVNYLVFTFGMTEARAKHMVATLTEDEWDALIGALQKAEA